MPRLLAIFLFGCALFAGRASFADSVWTDANIITGLDVSGSIDARDARIEVDGIAMAVRSPQIIAAIQNGKYRRIGFALFVWADGSYPVFDTWRLISSPEDALKLSQEVGQRLDAIVGSNIMAKIGALTDLSAAIDYGSAMLQTAPYPTDHRIINIVGNGVDNVAGPAWVARDRAVAKGITVNGVALGPDRTLLDYFKREVIGGPDSFALPADDSEHLVEVLAHKFMTEIAAANQPNAQAFK